MNQTAKNYLPAAGLDWLLPLYDPFVKLLGVDRLRNALLTGAAIQPGHRILDIGCGTGTLVTLIKRCYPDVEVIGLDPDPKALARAARKARRANVAVQLDQGFSNELPYPDASFDRVLSSFMFHHVEPAQNRQPCGKSGGRLSPAASFTYWISVDPPSSRKAFSLVCCIRTTG